MHHLMVELFSLDDVGQSYDVALSRKDCVSVTLGRHTNDFMTSFYCKTPSSFMVECGWGGREIDPSSWRPVEMQDGPSLWGHERVWLPEKDRDVARELRMRLACDGKRAPVQVMGIPISDAHVPYLQKVADNLRQQGIRVTVDDSDDRMQKKIRTAQQQKVPYMLIAGDADVAAEAVSFRYRDGSQKNGVPVAEAVAEIVTAVRDRAQV